MDYAMKHRSADSITRSTAITTPSPPKPVPALHGSLSLPYARNPSGTDSMINDPHQGYLSQVWGVKTNTRPPRLPSTSSMTKLNGYANHGDYTQRQTAERDSKENQPVAPPAPYTSHTFNTASRPIAIEDPHQVIGRKRSGSNRALRGLPPTIETLQPSHTMGSLRAETMTPIESGSESEDTPSRLDMHLTMTHPTSIYQARPGDPVLSALAFQSKLLSPDPKPRHTTPPRAAVRSASASHVIDGYGPPQPPTVSPISAERKAAIVAAERRKSLGAGSPGRLGDGSPSRRPPASSYNGSPGRPTLPRSGSDGKVFKIHTSHTSPMRTPARSNSSASPSSQPIFMPGSWASRTVNPRDFNLYQQQNHTSRTPHSPETLSKPVPQAKMRYSPGRSEWVAMPQPGNLQVHPQPKRSTSNPVIKPTIPASTSQLSANASTNQLGRSVSAPMIDRPRSPFDFTFLQPLPASTSANSQTKQQTGLGLGRPGSIIRQPKGPAMAAPTVEENPVRRHRLNTDENEKYAVAFPTLFASRKAGDVGVALLPPPTKPKDSGHSLAASAFGSDNSLANPFLDSSTIDQGTSSLIDPGRRVVSEPILDGPTVTTGFANFISSSRIVSDPTPLSKPQQAPVKKRNRNKSAKKGFPNPEPVVHNWDSLKEKFDYPIQPTASTSTAGYTAPPVDPNPIITKPTPTITSITNPLESMSTSTKPASTKSANRKCPVVGPETKLKSSSKDGHEQLKADTMCFNTRAGRPQRDIPPHQASNSTSGNRQNQMNASRQSHERPLNRNFQRNVSDGNARPDEPVDLDAWTRGRKRHDKPQSASATGWARARQNPPQRYYGHSGNTYDVASTGMSLN